MLKFPVNALPRSLEVFLREVCQAPGQSLRMPIQLKWGGGLGGAVSAVQVIATWARLHDGGNPLVLPPAFAEHESTQDRFASTLPGMAALYFSGSVTCGASEISRYKALEAVAPRVTAMQRGEFQDTLRGVGAALVCFAGAKSEFLKPLYARPNPGGVRDHSDFRILIPRMLSSLGPSIVEHLSEGQLDLLSALVQQLFLNTDEHGSSDASGNPYNTGMRGITTRVTTIESVSSLVKYAGDDTTLRSYLSKLALLPSRPGQDMQDKKLPGGGMRLVELSVFDTGPGLGLRWLSGAKGYTCYADFDEDEELEAIQTCFEKHSTTKASQFSGLGLTMALMAMKRLNAFMTLRTGRVGLYQDFSVEKTEAFKPRRRFAPRQRLSEIAGTAYTIWFRVK